MLFCLNLFFAAREDFNYFELLEDDLFSWISLSFFAIDFLTIELRYF